MEGVHSFASFFFSLSDREIWGPVDRQVSGASLCVIYYRASGGRVVQPQKKLCGRL